MILTRRAWLALAWLACLVIFGLDLAVPSATACGVLYVLAIWIAGRASSRHAIMAMACATSLLTILGGVLSPDSQQPESVIAVQVFTNRLIALLAIWLVSGLTLQWVETSLAQQHERQENEVAREELQRQQSDDLRKRRTLISVMEDLRLEVAQRKQLEHRLRRTQYVVDQAQDVVLLVEREGKVVYANESATELLGYSVDELMQLRPSDFDESCPQQNWDEYWHALISIKDQIYESRHRRKDNTYVDCQVRSSLLRFEGESLLVLFIRDVSQIKRAEAFRASLFEQSTNPHLIFGQAGILDCNRAAVEILGFESKERLLSHHPAKFSPTYQPDGQRSDQKCVEMDQLAFQKGFHRFEWMHQTLSKKELPCEVTLTPVHHRDGECLLVVWQDLRERKTAEAELRNREALL